MCYHFGMSKWTAESAVEYWVKRKLLTKKKATQLLDSLDEGEAELPSRALGIFATIGAVLLGLGVILFFASNWSAMTPMVKEAVLMTGLIASGWGGYYLAFERGEYETVGKALLFVNILLFGASIFLIGQIYHLQLNFWLGALLWCTGTLLFAYILESRLHAWLAVPLLILFLGWLRSTHLSGFIGQLDFLFDDRYSMLGLMPIIGMGLIALSIIHNDRRSVDFAAKTYFSWGLFLILMPIVTSTASSVLLFEFFSLKPDAIALTIIGVSLLLFCAAEWIGRFNTPQGRWGLVALVAYFAFVSVVAKVPEMLGFPDEVYRYGAENYFLITGLHIVHVLLVFVLLLTVIWFGTLLKHITVINMGMLGIAFLILIQYFSFAYSLQDRSLFFMMGGVLLIVLSGFLEKKRKLLIMHISTSKK